MKKFISRFVSNFMLVWFINQIILLVSRPSLKEEVEITADINRYTYALGFPINYLYVYSDIPMVSGFECIFNGNLGLHLLLGNYILNYFLLFAILIFLERIYNRYTNKNILKK